MKLTLDALQERADAVASEELLLTISGGTENACHDEGYGDNPDLSNAPGDPHSVGSFMALGYWISSLFE